MRPNLRVIHQKDANGIANSEDPDQAAPLICVCTVCPDLFVQKLWIITVLSGDKLPVEIDLRPLNFCLFLWYD